MSLYSDAQIFIQNALHAAQPDEAVKKALGAIALKNKKRVFLVAIGKAAWQMSKAAIDLVGDRIDDGVVITKYDHAKGPLPKVRIFEAGHPVLDEATLTATQEALTLTQKLDTEDAVLFLVSGGGSALFEQPAVELSELRSITEEMLAKGADIVEMNTIRKRLSHVKGGRFALHVAPAHVYAIILSDIIGDPLDMVASGPAYPDSSTAQEALAIVHKYDLTLSTVAKEKLMEETPKILNNVTTMVTGSVTELCRSAEETALSLGYTPHVLTASLRGEAKEVGSFMASIAEYHQDSKRSLAYIAGGETIVRLTGSGKGGRNQEIALSAAQTLSSLRDTCLFSIGSDGTDGPTDAAGGYVDRDSYAKLLALGVDPFEVLMRNDSYHALQAIDGLIMTGPTGTNVNDLTVLLIRR